MFCFGLCCVLFARVHSLGASLPAGQGLGVAMVGPTVLALICTVHLCPHLARAKCELLCGKTHTGRNPVLVNSVRSFCCSVGPQFEDPRPCFLIFVFHEGKSFEHSHTSVLSRGTRYFFLLVRTPYQYCVFPSSEMNIRTVEFRSYPQVGTRLVLDRSLYYMIIYDHI